MDIIALKKLALDLIFPKICLGCREEGSFLCASCVSDINDKVEIQRCPICSFRNFSGILCPSCKKYSQLTRLIFALNYKNPLVRDLIHGCKYHGIRELAEPLGNILTATLKKNDITITPSAIIVPIPLHRRKLRRRGFNQAELIAKVMAEQYALHMSSKNLMRKIQTESQIEFADFTQRRANVKNCFAISNPHEFAGKRIILVDDVSTSRSTLDEAAQALKSAGAKAVWGVVVAKG